MFSLNDDYCYASTKAQQNFSGKENYMNINSRSTAITLNFRKKNFLKSKCIIMS